MKVPIEYKEQIEQTINDKVTQRVKATVSQPTTWLSSLTYPYKSDGSLCICLNPKDFNKVIVWEHYKAPTLNKTSQQLSGATCFSKLHTEDCFCSVHLNEKSSYLTTFNTHCCRSRFLHMPFVLRMSQYVFQMCMDQVMDHLPGIIAIHDDIYIYSHTLKSMTDTCYKSWIWKVNMASSSVAPSARSGSPKLPSMVQSSLLRAWTLTPPRFKPS